ncbi:MULTISPECIES: histone-like nucleoid-structuring protein Lsr2 [Streptomyces]|uniref:Lsr2 family protein n=1 Tax=Streptomyces luteolus TaxID=3043615 RepID=A0ABT6T867_9ACTN|nr:MULTISPECIES: Lsr2 family protein [unclassified Streptomyces]MDI3424065.1 Lsr2 family protein [Streptomyces sp. B-S-A12]MDQ8702897.1 Lsr2 family protein [Streptomyces sp. LHD-70]
MAQKVITTYVDDLTGEESEQIATHSILVDGAGVEIDLTDENYEKLLELLNPYLHADGARRIRGGSKPKGKRKPATGKSDDSSAIRAWARENGYEVSERGRVPAAVREAYESAR